MEYPQSFIPVFTCDKTRCKMRERLVFCFNYSRYPHKQCHFYTSGTANPPEHDLTQSKLEQNRELDGQ